MDKADVVDIFSSIQGEGIFLGAKQIFVRFKKCNLNCVFCDEPRDADSKEYSGSKLLEEVRRLDREHGPHHSVSITGGEPLLYADFLKGFLKLLKKDGFKVYLETNGTLPRELSKVIDLVDIIAMDFKLPSSTGEDAFWKEHREFLEISTKKKVFIKVIVTPKTKRSDITKAIRLLRKVNEKIPFILQPATPVRRLDSGVNNATLLKFLEEAARNKFENIRIMPQIHKILNVK